MTLPLIATFPFLDDVAKPEDLKPGAWAFVIVVGLLLVTVLLWFSLRKQLRRIDVPYANEDTEQGKGYAGDVTGDVTGEDAGNDSGDD